MPSSVLVQACSAGGNLCQLASQTSRLQLTACVRKGCSPVCACLTKLFDSRVFSHQMFEPGLVRPCPLLSRPHYRAAHGSSLSAPTRAINRTMNQLFPHGEDAWTTPRVLAQTSRSQHRLVNPHFHARSVTEDKLLVTLRFSC